MKTTHIPTAVLNELTFTGEQSTGSSGLAVKRLQEWLCYHDCSTPIDSDFGPATQAALKNFQLAKAFDPTGILTEETWNILVSPMASALSDGVGQNLGDRVGSIAANHLAVHPREFGGDNCGPWVRIYTGGHEGAKWKWCAGFASFVVHQAADELEVPSPIRGSLSCDELATQAKDAGRFVQGSGLFVNSDRKLQLGNSFIFLIRESANDWSHAGLGFSLTGQVFSTIEGNTNDVGSAEGYEVCARTRSVSKADFIGL
ncbi:peptidoglycan-binding domain-containing protein [Pigmentiphaga litoralis]|uniref:Peptidoglycan binding-like domain-containing protein n=1 Tax=Pigmentiphaga litoralis TaxID=516702 RepID=A0A7Y9LMN0_9BURK|nr:peptidoglycan-binding domain-containing protein [Pigmentiphaga litoralis]NYE24530.1 hypothetical protein [Pigmentiphaga litoralis]NYE81856.1 hypothetical protein [Pigmentiphaga litoralis]